MSALHWAVAALFLVIILLHAASALFKCNTVKILAYVNIGLHIAAILLFLLAEVSLDVVALCFMSDLLIYLVLNLLTLSPKKRREDEDDL